MPNQSSKTVPVNFRIPIDLYEIIQKRLEKKPGKWVNVNEYAKERFIYDASRPH